MFTFCFQSIFSDFTVHIWIPNLFTRFPHTVNGERSWLLLNGIDGSRSRAGISSDKLCVQMCLKWSHFSLKRRLKSRDIYFEIGHLRLKYLQNNSVQFILLLFYLKYRKYGRNQHQHAQLGKACNVWPLFSFIAPLRFIMLFVSITYFLFILNSLFAIFIQSFVQKGQEMMWNRIVQCRESDSNSCRLREHQAKWY